MSRTSFCFIPWIIVGLGILGIIMGIIMGIVRGEDTVLFTKAVAICLECIGIG